MKYAVLGAGLTGLTISRLLSDAGHDVTVYEKDNGIGGMCREELDENGTLYSVYGPHIFHTNDEEVWQFVNKYCKMKEYKHAVKALTNKGLYNWPINYDTLKDIFKGKDEQENIELWQKDIEMNKKGLNDEDNFENIAISKIGKRLYEAFIKTYTNTQWQRSPQDLPSELFGRIRIEESYNNNFFNDKYVALPVLGFSDLMLGLIENLTLIKKEITYDDLEQLKQNYDKIISTIPPWILLNEKPLEMININFEDASKMEEIQYMEEYNLSVLNLCNNEKYTRITDYGTLYKHINSNHKYIVETPGDSGIPLYPIQLKSNIDKAQDMVAKLNNLGIISIGRLGLYKYINMDQAIRQGIDIFKILEGEKDGRYIYSWWGRI